MFNKKKNVGERCQVEEGGVRTCKVFEANKHDGKESTGTEFSFTVSKENGCDPIMVGDYDIMEKDRGRVNATLKQYSDACKKGLV